VEGRNWDRAALETALKPAIDFQKKYNVQIYLGEFSAIRWAPDGSAARYLSDVIDICEAYGWDWTYHAFREWSGWSVEHGSAREDNRPAAEPTDRQKVLCSWLAKNKKPAWTTGNN
jgi:endoglucanase